MVNIEKLDFDRIALIKKIGKLFPDGKGVEVGTFKGAFAREILLNWSGHLYMVDVWRGLNDNEYQDGSNHYSHNDAFELTMLNIDGFEDRATMIRTKSTQGADLFQDNSLDFVYIDANHAYDYVVEDMEKWYPKLKMVVILLVMTILILIGIIMNSNYWIMEKTYIWINL
mgnify:CR=1 FL=1